MNVTKTSKIVYEKPIKFREIMNMIISKIGIKINNKNKIFKNLS